MPVAPLRRLRPLARWQELFAPNRLFPALLLLLLPGLLLAAWLTNTPLDPVYQLGAGLACLLLAGYLAWELGRPLWWALTLARGAGEAEAAVLSRERRHHFVSWSETNPNQYSYHLVVAFETPQGAIRLDAEVSPKLQKKWTEGRKLRLRYALSAPRIALLEGE
jgi:hypothetical protein